ncbi:MAG TPA: hypothetical protein VGG99_11585 [Acetobacteraceae bacterium]
MTTTGRATSEPIATSGGQPERRTPGQVVKDIILFFAAPFITFAYLSLFPFIGLAMLTRRGERAWHRWKRAD